MRSLIDDDPAALRVPAPAPGRQVVVVTAPPEFDDGLAENRLSHAALVDGLADAHGAGVPAPLKNDGQLGAMLAAGRDCPVRVSEGRGKWLLNDAVNAVGSAGLDHWSVFGMGRAHANRFHQAGVEHCR